MEQWQKNLYAAWFTQIISLSGFGLMGPFIPLYIQELGVSDPTALRFWVGLITSVASLCFAVMAPLWGLLADRFGRKLMLLRSMAAGTIVIGLMGLAQSVVTVFVLRIIQGLLTGTVTAAAVLVSAGTPEKKMSYAMGFLSSSTYIGLALGPLVGGLVAEYVGFRAAFFTGSVILFIGFFLVLLFIKEIPSDSGHHSSISFHPKMLLKSPFIILFFLVFLVRFSRMLSTTFLPLFVQELLQAARGTSAITGLISALTAISTAAAGLTLARLGDRYARLPFVALCFGTAAVIAFPLFFTGSLLSFAPFYVLAYFFIGAIDPLLLSHLSTSTPPRYRGFVLGLQTSAGSLGWFLAPLVGSAVSIYFSIGHIFLFFSLSLWAAFLITAVYHRLKSRS